MLLIKNSRNNRNPSNNTPHSRNEDDSAKSGGEGGEIDFSKLSHPATHHHHLATVPEIQMVENIAKDTKDLGCKTLKLYEQMAFFLFPLSKTNSNFQKNFDDRRPNVVFPGFFSSFPPNFQNFEFHGCYTYYYGKIMKSKSVHNG